MREYKKCGEVKGWKTSGREASKKDLENTFLLRIIGVYLYVVCVHTCMHACSSTCKGQRLALHASSVHLCVILWDRVYHWTCHSPAQLEAQAIKSLGSSCLCLPPTLPPPTLHAQFSIFTWILGIQMQVLMFKCLALYLLSDLPSPGAPYCRGPQDNWKCAPWRRQVKDKGTDI